MRLPLILFLAASPCAYALEDVITLCTMSTDERKVHVAYPQKAATPCEVRYTKAGDTRILWNAMAETGFCEEKAAKLIVKLEAQGFACSSQANEKIKSVEAITISKLARVRQIERKQRTTATNP